MLRDVGDKKTNRYGAQYTRRGLRVDVKGKAADFGERLTEQFRREIAEALDTSAGFFFFN